MFHKLLGTSQKLSCFAFESKDFQLGSDNIVFVPNLNTKGIGTLPHEMGYSYDLVTN